MNAPNLIASAAAVLITIASLNVVNYNVTPPATTAGSHAIEVFNLAPVDVRPTAEERRNAALMADIATAGLATMPAAVHTDASGKTEQVNLLGTELTMPYYSFGTRFGRITKE